MSTKTLPLDDPRFVKFMSGCPFRWQGDHGAIQWLGELYDLGAAGGFPALPTPVISALSPDSGPAGADITLAITGTDFDSLASVNIGAAYGLVPTNFTPTELSVLVEAVNIAEPGTLALSVKNPDGQLSNALDFSVLDPASEAHAAQAPPAPVAPLITELAPSTTPANVGVNLLIVGSGFDDGATVMVGPAELVPIDIPTPTECRVDISAPNISMRGAVEIRIKNSDGLQSNVMSLPLT